MDILYNTILQNSHNGNISTNVSNEKIPNSNNKLQLLESVANGLLLKILWLNKMIHAFFGYTQLPLFLQNYSSFESRSEVCI